MLNLLTGSIPAPPPPTTTEVSTAAALQAALNAGNTDVTLIASVTAPSGGINVPRLSGGRILRCSGSGILNRGATTGHVLRSDGTGGSLTLIGFRVDGGWRTNMHEGGDSESNYYLPDYTFLRLENCVTCYSYRTGFLVAGSARVEIAGCTLFACPRDHVWADGVRDLLIEDCLVQHCGDDGLGTHQARGSGLITMSIIMRRNTLRDTFGMKFHCGAADGTHNGKPSQILIEDNTFEACGLYGVHGHEETLHNNTAPHNVTFRRNIIRDVRRTAPSAPGQVIGVAMRFAWASFTYDNTFHIESNTCIRNPSVAGQTLQSAYGWGQLNSPDKPQNVPGAGAFQGFFSKGGFQPTATFDLASIGTVIQGSNQAAIQHSGNSFQGAGWTDTIT